ncbi:hypothetical protein BDN71DRAFT_1510396 [Pleurotus eryngii]|uniref:Uncharacterized protein n=1 Tax=Pleurotus eryngii TaxID=5323 RepID=A0A9P6D3Q1_PLEER|nr:hypothetical protein BDN71DRAFT_1510396 [Pleurotus eryngii]
MGCMCNHGKFILSKGQLLEQQFNHEICTTKQDMMEPEKAAVKSRNLQALQGNKVDAGIAVQFAQTLTSVDFDGNLLNSKMLPIMEHMLTIKLSDREMENLGLLIDEMEFSESGVPTNLSLKVSNEDWPIFNMEGNSKLGHYNDISSTKLNLVAHIMLHLLSHNHIEHPMMDDGEVIFPSLLLLVFRQ